MSWLYDNGREAACAIEEDRTNAIKLAAQKRLGMMKRRRQAEREFKARQNDGVSRGTLF
jgi:hypothetical protein